MCVCFAVSQRAEFTQKPPCRISEIDSGCVSSKAKGCIQKDKLCLCGQLRQITL